MIVEIGILLCLVIVFFWFWTVEPKYGHHFVEQEPWETSYAKVSDNLAGWEGAVFEEAE